MFNKEKSTSFETPVISRTSSKDITTLIGEGCKIEGNFFIPTSTRIDGTVKGDLNGEAGIVIGNSGKVEGNIFATEVVVYGEVKGKIETKRLELKKGSHLNGDINVTILIAENGCSFNGNCIMNEVIQQTAGDPVNGISSEL
jgi:cytoskeletal protein CcmA (bactofilin family)